MSLEDDRWRCTWKGDRISVSNYHWLHWDDVGEYELLAEPFCKICACPDVIITNTFSICSNNCHELYGFDRIYAVDKYYPVDEPEHKGHLLSEHINKLKRNSYYARPLGMAMVLVVQNKYTDLVDSHCIVPVPQHRDKYAERPFNPAQKLAETIGKRLGLPMLDVLEKTRNESATGRGRHERLEMVKGLYAFKNEKPSLEGKRVMLIDDTVTVGADAAECSKVLKENGASTVKVLVAGRTYRTQTI